MTGCAFLEDAGRLGAGGGGLLPPQPGSRHAEQPAAPSLTKWSVGSETRTRRWCWGLGSARLMLPWQRQPCPTACPGEGQLAGETQETQNNGQKQDCTAPVFSRCPSFSHPVRLPWHHWFIAPSLCGSAVFHGVFWLYSSTFKIIKLFINFYSIPSSLTASDPTSLTRGPAKDCRMWRQAHSCSDTQTRAARRAKGRGDPSV